MKFGIRMSAGNIGGWEWFDKNIERPFEDLFRFCGKGVLGGYPFANWLPIISGIAYFYGQSGKSLSYVYLIFNRSNFSDICPESWTRDLSFLFLKFSKWKRQFANKNRWVVKLASCALKWLFFGILFAVPYFEFLPLPSPKHADKSSEAVAQTDPVNCCKEWKEELWHQITSLRSLPMAACYQVSIKLQFLLGEPIRWT